jgi:GTP-binding protein Era
VEADDALGQYSSISALHDFNIKALVDMIVEKLPEGPEYFPKDTLTDKTLRFFAAEILREKILLNYQKEIPYSVEVEIEEYKESEAIDRIRALIFVDRESQKSISLAVRVVCSKWLEPKPDSNWKTSWGKKYS